MVERFQSLVCFLVRYHAHPAEAEVFSSLWLRDAIRDLLGCGAFDVGCRCHTLLRHCALHSTIDSISPIVQYITYQTQSTWIVAMNTWVQYVYSHTNDAQQILSIAVAWSNHSRLSCYTEHAMHSSK